MNTDLTCKTCDWWEPPIVGQIDDFGTCHNALAKGHMLPDWWCSEHSGIRGNKQRRPWAYSPKIGDLAELEAFYKEQEPGDANG